MSVIASRYGASSTDDPSGASTTAFADCARGLREDRRELVDRVLRLGAGDRERLLELAAEGEAGAEERAEGERPGDDDEPRPAVGEAADAVEKEGHDLSQSVVEVGRPAAGSSSSPSTACSTPRSSSSDGSASSLNEAPRREQVGGAAEGDAEADLLVEALALAR